MRSQTAICVRWKLTGRMEIFVNLGKLDRKNLFELYENDVIEILKTYVK